MVRGGPESDGVPSNGTHTLLSWITMPVMDGRAAEEIRALGCDSLIVGVTGCLYRRTLPISKLWRQCCIDQTFPDGGTGRNLVEFGDLCNALIEEVWNSIAYLFIKRQRTEARLLSDAITLAIIKSKNYILVRNNRSCIIFVDYRKSEVQWHLVSSCRY
jgi:hypothetical protein